MEKMTLGEFDVRIASCILTSEELDDVLNGPTTSLSTCRKLLQNT